MTLLPEGEEIGVMRAAMENLIVNDKNLSRMRLKVHELLDLIFLEQLAQERKAKGK